MVPALLTGFARRVTVEEKCDCRSADLHFRPLSLPARHATQLSLPVWHHTVTTKNGGSAGSQKGVFMAVVFNSMRIPRPARLVPQKNCHPCKLCSALPATPRLLYCIALLRFTYTFSIVRTLRSTLLALKSYQFRVRAFRTSSHALCRPGGHQNMLDLGSLHRCVFVSRVHYSNCQIDPDTIAMPCFPPLLPMTCRVKSHLPTFAQLAGYDAQNVEGLTQSIVRLPFTPVIFSIKRN